MREAALALGVPRWRTTISVVARTAISGIATGVILAVARVAGETAPLLVHRVRQSLLVNFALSTDLFADGAGLYLRHLAIRRLATTGLGRRAGADRDRPGDGTGREMGNRGHGESRQIAMPEKVIVKHLRAFFNKNEALHDVSLSFAENRVTAIIGPSGCGKSTLVRCINRMHEVVPGATCTGEVLLDGNNIYAPDSRSGAGAAANRDGVPEADAVSDHVNRGQRRGRTEVQRDFGIARADRERLVEKSLRQAALWEEVKDRLGRPGAAACRAGSNSACASRGRSRSSPRCC